jgi:hypothetical protein
MKAIPTQDLSKYGKGNDTLVAHISPREAMILKMFGGSGTINKDTGLFEFNDDGPGGGQGEGSPGGDSGVGESGGIGSAAEAAANAAAQGIGLTGTSSVNDMGQPSMAIDATPESQSTHQGGVLGMSVDELNNEESVSSATSLDTMSRSKSTMETISDMIGNIVHGFGHTAKGMAGAKAGALIGNALIPGLGIPLGILGAKGLNYALDNLETPSAEGLASISAMGSNQSSGPADTVADVSGIPTSTSSPLGSQDPRRFRLHAGIPAYRQYNALTGLRK